MGDGKGVGGGGAGGQGALGRLVRSGQDALGRLQGKQAPADARKSDRAEEAETGRADGAPSGAPASGLRGRTRARGRNFNGLQRLIGGSDDFRVEDEERERKRNQRLVLGDDESPEFAEQNGTENRSAIAHISLEFRGQVTAGLTAGRSFTQGSCVVPDEDTDLDGLDDDEEYEEVVIRRKKRKA